MTVRTRCLAIYILGIIFGLFIGAYNPNWIGTLALVLMFALFYAALVP